MFDFEDVKPFLTVLAVKTLENDPISLQRYKDSAIYLAKQYVEIDTQTAINKAYLLPLAWLISYFSANMASRIEKDEMQRYDTLFQNAINLLKTEGLKQKKFNTGTITGLME